MLGWCGGCLPGRSHSSLIAAGTDRWKGGWTLNHGAPGQGSNSAVVRQFNERVILTALRRLSEASKADLARHVNLTQRASGQIVKEL